MCSRFTSSFIQNWRTSGRSAQAPKSAFLNCSPRRGHWQEDSIAYSGLDQKCSVKVGLCLLHCTVFSQCLELWTINACPLPLLFHFCSFHPDGSPSLPSSSSLPPSSVLLPPSSPPLSSPIPLPSSTLLPPFHPHPPHLPSPFFPFLSLSTFHLSPLPSPFFPHQAEIWYRYISKVGCCCAFNRWRYSCSYT